ncbi:MAG: hypothetical protein QOC71_808 [Thermoplasmata archaeon]|jgi:hypothetical protein|nr:hypothetical protein [Thermoplasmata archaeon]
MGHGRPPQSKRARASNGESAVTPVIGAILILAISVLGIAGVLYWGAPTLERIQAGNAQSAMVGEFEDLRAATRELSVPDHSRFPTVVVPGGELQIQKGSRIMVTTDHDSTHPTCDFRVTKWADTTDPTRFTLSTTGCRTTLFMSGTHTGANEAVLEVLAVSGPTTTARTVTSVGGGVYSVAGANFAAGDWLFRLSNGATPLVVYSQAWLHSGDQIRWDLGSGAGEYGIHLDAGTLFSRRQGTLFLERDASIGDSSFGTDYYGLWLRTLTADRYSGITGAGSHQVYLSLLGNAVRVDEPGVYNLRYDISGDLAQSWCNALVVRNTSLVGASYTSTPNAACAGDVDGVRSIRFQRADGADAGTDPDPFAFRMLHARIYASLSV